METSVKRLVIALVALGGVLSFTSVPGVFTVDENNYLVNVLALRQGRLSVRNTEGLPASPELLFFDPTNDSRRIRSTPVTSTAPPLYAAVALPFSFFGWRGLAALNTIAYLLTILLVFRYTARYASERSTPGIAAAAFALGGYAIEYAIGLWPHALSFALCTAGVMAAGRALDAGDPRSHRTWGPASAGPTPTAALAGFLLAVAAGVRYQNAAVLVVVGGAILLLAPARRWAASVAYGAGAIVPLAISAAINHARLDSWNPISKGSGYLTVPISGGTKSSLVEPLVMLWGQIVDYTARPALTAADVTPWLTYDAMTGTHLIFGAIAKKAVLQSAPWAILAFLMFAAAWLPLSRIASNRRRQLRFLSVAAVGMVGPFMVSGVARHDGLAFNARYFLELLPIAAIGLGFAIDGRLPARLRPSAIGAAAGGILAGAMLVITPGLGGPDNPWWVARQLAVMKLPLVLSGTAAIVWLLDTTGQRRPALLAAVVGACIGWGFVVHGAIDVGASTVMRSLNQERARALEEVVPDRAAVVAYWGAVNPVGSLLFTRDLVAVDIRADQGHDGAAVIQALLAQGRRVFLLNDGMPPEVVRRATGDLYRVPVAHSKLPVVELRSSAE